MGAGMDVARLNFSHGTHETHRNLFMTVRDAAAETGRNVAILMDLQGPKIRTGPLKGGQAVELEEGAEFILTTEHIEGTAKRVSTSYEALPDDVAPGDRILMSDGSIELLAARIEGREVHCRVKYGGVLGQFKGINLPGVNVSAPSLTEKDREDLDLALELGADYVALSFVRDPEDLRRLREHIDNGGGRTGIISKIERPEALDRIVEIIELSDAVMVARGDLGVEVPLDHVPQIQKDLIQRCNEHGKPVITATQMLESMMTNARPTRAEVTDVANAIYDGTDAVMLSGETAAGSYPVRAVEVMARVAQQADQAIRVRERSMGHHDVKRPDEHAVATAVGEAAFHITESLPIDQILCFTSSGYTAMRISRFRPRVPIIAVTLSAEASRRCALFWGVEAMRTVEVANLDDMIAFVDNDLVDQGILEEGRRIVLVAGAPLAVSGRTNLLKLHTVGEEQRTAH
jgi:pyruvate kinase